MATAPQKTVQPGDSGSVDADELARMLDEHNSARRAANFALVKAAGMVLGVCVTVVSVGTGVWTWASSSLRASFEREQEQRDQVERVDGLEANTAELAKAVRAMERVMELERVEREHEQAILGMILSGQGQDMPAVPPKVQAAREEIEQLLSE